MSTPTLEQILGSLPARFRPEKLLDNFSACYHFQFREGDHILGYTVRISQEGCRVTHEDTDQPDCRIITDSATYIGIELGTVNAQTAIFSGALQADNLTALLQFSKFFQKYVADDRATKNEAFFREAPKGVLEGIRILDFSRLLPAPLTTMWLADMGADVIKIEDPASPDPIRQYPPFLDGQSAYYLAVNRNKRSFTLNLHTSEGKAVFMDLVATADIVVDSFRPGILQKMGLDYDSVSRRYPHIIYLALTGYGQTGSSSHRAGHDINYIAEAGILALNGVSSNSQPTIPSVQVADVCGSYCALSACLLALYNRQRTGKGELVDVAMFRAVMPMLTLPYAAYAASSQLPKRGETELSGGLPNYNVYRCSDGNYLALGALEPKFWAGFCQMVQQPDWEPRLLPSHPTFAQLAEDIAAILATQPMTAWLEQAKIYDICLSPVRTLDELERATSGEVLSDEIPFWVRQTTSTGDNVQSIANPFRMMAYKGWTAPRLGEDNTAILNELG